MLLLPPDLKPLLRSDSQFEYLSNSCLFMWHWWLIPKPTVRLQKRSRICVRFLICVLCECCSGEVAVGFHVRRRVQQITQPLFISSPRKPSAPVSAHSLGWCVSLSPPNWALTYHLLKTDEGLLVCVPGLWAKWSNYWNWTFQTEALVKGSGKPT